MIGLPLCRWQLTSRDIGWFHLVGEKYIHAVTGFGAFPLMIPAFGDDLDMDTVLDSVSGIMFGGSLSNVHPSFYGECSCAAWRCHCSSCCVSLWCY
ncbi:gamma-glutamyl-gamma-aminobutyrate hydrolase family protein [Pseudomonas sp.]